MEILTSALPFLALAVAVGACAVSAFALRASLPARVYRELKDLHQAVQAAERNTEASRTRVATLSEEVEAMLDSIEVKRKQAQASVARAGKAEKASAEPPFDPNDHLALTRRARQLGLM